MRLAPRLLLVSLVTLLLPWVGCQYLRDVEASLRQGQEDTLLAASGTLAGTLAARTDELSIDPARFRAGRTASLDLYAHRLRGPVTLDGFSDDWGLDDRAFSQLSTEGDLSLRYAVGETRAFIYLMLSITDDRVVYGQADLSDAIRLRIARPGGGFEDLIFATEAPGTVRPSVLSGGFAGRVEANWQATSRGYNVEIRLPVSITGGRLGFLVTDRDGPGAAEPVAGSLASVLSPPGWLIRRLPAVESELARATQPDTRIRLADPVGFLLADTGRPTSGAEGPDSGLMRRLARLALGRTEAFTERPIDRPGRVATTSFQTLSSRNTGVFRFGAPGTDRLLLVSARWVPVAGDVAALLLVEQDSDAILSLTDRAASRLFGASFVAGLVAAAFLLGFAAWLSMRIRRLSGAAAGAVGHGGEIATELPEVDSRDELGDLARSFSRLLGKVRDHNLYLQSLGGKLTHELRTPITVIKTSLENLADDPSGESAPRYLQRARAGIDRLQNMVSALGAATRMEEAISTAETTRFDLAALVREMGTAYASTHGDRDILTRIECRSCVVDGAPELIVQMLDKLFENALDFCPPGGRIELTLSSEPEACRLGLRNTGQPIPAGLEGRLFDSLVSSRQDKAGSPHLGLGLYIVRLVAEHHHGSVSARNLEDELGVEFTVSLPTLR